MPFTDIYRKQVELLVQSIPPVAKEQCFALKGGTAINLFVRTPHLVQIKIEVTPVLRGCVYDPQPRTIVERAEEQFGFAEIQVLSFADLYAGKNYGSARSPTSTRSIRCSRASYKRGTPL